MIDLSLILALALALGDEPQSKSAPAAPGTVEAKPFDSAQGKPSQDPDRPAISAVDLKALRDSNIFAPRTAKRRPPPSTPSRRSETAGTPPAPPKPKAPVITGIFFDGKAQAWLVVVEDRNDAALRQFKEPKFLKAGDEVSGHKVGTVTAERAVFLKGDSSKELKVGDSLPSDEAKPFSAATPEDPEAAAAADGEVEIKPLDSAAKTEVLEALKKKRGKKDRPSNDE